MLKAWAFFIASPLGQLSTTYTGVYMWILKSQLH